MVFPDIVTHSSLTLAPRPILKCRHDSSVGGATCQANEPELILHADIRYDLKTHLKNPYPKLWSSQAGGSQSALRSGEWHQKPVMVIRRGMILTILPRLNPPPHPSREPPRRYYPWEYRKADRIAVPGVSLNGDIRYDRKNPYPKLWISQALDNHEHFFISDTFLSLRAYTSFYTPIGVLPAAMGQLTKLTSLDLHNTGLSGT